MKSNISDIFYSNYIKYDRLKVIVNLFKPNSYMDIYIDLYPILKRLYNNREEFKIDCYTAITSCVINMCAHYRAFFSQYNIDTTFYIVNSMNINRLNKTFVSEYNAKVEYMIRLNDRIRGIINSNLDLLNTLCPYLPDIHFINSQESFESGAIMNYIMDIANPDCNRYNVVITKDLYNYQLASKPNTFILRPKKQKQGDTSYVISQENLIKILLYERKSSIQDTFLDSGLISIILTLSNCPERNIKSLLNLTTAISILEEAIKLYKLNNGYNFHIRTVWDALSANKAVYNIGDTGLTYRFKAIDLLFQSSVYSNSVECGLLNFNNLYDPENVKRINEQYFQNNIPLDLEAL